MLGLPVCATWLKCTLGHGSPISKSGNHSHPSVIPLNETVLHFEWSAKSVHKSCNRLGAFPQTNTWQSRNPFGILPTSQFRISSEYVFKGSDFSHSVILTSNCQSLCVDRLCVYTPKCMHVCVCMLPLACYVYTYVCAHMYTCLHVYAYTCLCIYIPAHVCSMYVGTRVYMAICGYTCICVYAHACMYKCIAAGTGMIRSAHQYFHPITEQKPTQCKKKRMNSHENHLFMYPKNPGKAPAVHMSLASLFTGRLFLPNTYTIDHKLACWAFQSTRGGWCMAPLVDWPTLVPRHASRRSPAHTSHLWEVLQCLLTCCLVYPSIRDASFSSLCRKFISLYRRESTFKNVLLYS